MAAEFVPFPRYEFAPASASALPEFLAVTPPVDTKSSVVIPADKALADLSEALRMGLDEAIIETILSGIRSPRILTKTRPISLRDLYAPEVVPPVKTQEPKAPGICRWPDICRQKFCHSESPDICRRTRWSLNYSHRVARHLPVAFIGRDSLQ
jgi:hypothetical protein